MEVNHQQELAPDPIPLQAATRKKADGTSNSRDLAEINAKLVRENEQLTHERDLLRLIIDSLPDLIYAKDRESRFLIGNSACAQALGANRPGEIAGKTDYDFFPRDPAERYFADEQAVMRSGQTFNTVESFVENGAREIRWMQTTKVARRDANGNICRTPLPNSFGPHWTQISRRV